MGRQGTLAHCLFRKKQSNKKKMQLNFRKRTKRNSGGGGTKGKSTFHKIPNDFSSIDFKILRENCVLTPRKSLISLCEGFWFSLLWNSETRK